MNILFNTMYLDFNCVYNFGEAQKYLTSAMCGKGSVSSLMSAIGKVSKKQIEEFTKNRVRD